MTGSPTPAAEAALVPDVHRIAVLRANSIGDFVLTVPALTALRKAYPSAEITYLGDWWHPELLDGRPGPWDRVAVVPPYAGIRGDDPATKDSPAVDRFFEEQRRRRYDLVVQLHGGGANSNPFARSLGGKVTVGLRDRDVPALDRWVPYRLHQHEVLRFLEVVALVGARAVELEPRLEVTPADLTAAGKALPDDIGGPVVALHPGANDARRRWPTESFAAVADELTSRGAKVLLVGHGPEDRRAASRILQTTLHQPVDLVDRLSLGALLGVLARCALVVANDSGPRHLAAAVGTATVGIYRGRNLVNTGPLSATRHEVAVSFRTTCPECGAEESAGSCTHDSSFVADVPVGQVLQMADELCRAEQRSPDGTPR